jgi:hypothetical protein
MSQRPWKCCWRPHTRPAQPRRGRWGPCTMRRMTNSKPLPRPLAWFCVVAASLMIPLGLVNFILNTKNVGTWLPILLISSLVLVGGVRSLRALGRANR